ncbi:MAG: hypothetical protein ACM3NI_12800 [Bacteroidota bacterium]
MLQHDETKKNIVVAGLGCIAACRRLCRHKLHFYAWLSAAAPERWPPERAALWAYSALALACLFFGFFVYCVVSLIKEANRQYREEQSAT